MRDCRRKRSAASERPSSVARARAPLATSTVTMAPRSRAAAMSVTSYCMVGPRGSADLGQKALQPRLLRVVDDGGGTAVLHDDAAVHEHDPVGNMAGEPDLVRDE